MSSYRDHWIALMHWRRSHQGAKYFARYCDETPRHDGIFSGNFIPDILLRLKATESTKSASIWRSYGQECNGALLLE